MTDVLTTDHIASVSLADADRDPEAFAQELGRSFVDYGFAVIRDHGIPQELIDRAEQLSKQFFALPEEAKRKYLIAGRAGLGATRRSGSRPPRACRRSTSRNSGTSGASFRPATNMNRACRPTSGRRRSRASRTPS